MYGRAHDSLDYISADASQAGISNLPVPVGMFMNMAHVPPRFYQQAMAQRGGRGGYGNNRGRGGGRGGGRGKNNNQMSNMPLSQSFSQQDPNTQAYSQPGLTQGPLSQVNIILII